MLIVAGIHAREGGVGGNVLAGIIRISLHDPVRDAEREVSIGRHCITPEGGKPHLVDLCEQVVLPIGQALAGLDVTDEQRPNGLHHGYGRVSAVEVALVKNLHKLRGVGESGAFHDAGRQVLGRGISQHAAHGGVIRPKRLAELIQPDGEERFLHLIRPVGYIHRAFAEIGNFLGRDALPAQGVVVVSVEPPGDHAGVQDIAAKEHERGIPAGGRAPGPLGVRHADEGIAVGLAQVVRCVDRLAEGLLSISSARHQGVVLQPLQLAVQAFQRVAHGERDVAYVGGILCSGAPFQVGLQHVGSALKRVELLGQRKVAHELQLLDGLLPAGAAWIAHNEDGVSGLATAGIPRKERLILKRPAVLIYPEECHVQVEARIRKVVRVPSKIAQLQLWSHHQADVREAAVGDGRVARSAVHAGHLHTQRGIARLNAAGAFVFDFLDAIAAGLGAGLVVPGLAEHPADGARHVFYAYHLFDVQPLHWPFVCSFGSVKPFFQQLLVAPRDLRDEVAGAVVVGHGEPPIRHEGRRA